MNVTNSKRIIRSARLPLVSMLASVLSVMAAPADAASDGRQLYLMHCAGCHGVSGISVTPDSKNFSRVELMHQPDQHLLDLIRSGRNMMPGYIGILSDQDIMSIINHIRTLN